MSNPDRREFLQSLPAAALAARAMVREPIDGQGASSVAPRGAIRLDTFDYRDVRLAPSRWQRQSDDARVLYLAISDDDILHGFRKAADMRAPGAPLGGWCGVNSNIVFGQWVSGMSRLARATADDRLRDKARALVEGWTATIGASGDPRMDHYAFDKLICGLVDFEKYAADTTAAAACARIRRRVTAFADKTFARPAAPLADINDNHAYYGRPQEWYTLAENLLRAYQLGGDQTDRTFAETWLYHAYWNKFRQSSSPDDAHGVHAYSHVNTFSSAAMMYEVSGDSAYLDIIRNAYDYLQKFQCYATGGYGPNERFMKIDGSLGRALDSRSDTFEAVCGSYAGFKLARYLMRFTGEARYGDWIERLFYNGVGAALPVTGRVRNFYYADYRVGGGMKVYNWDTCTCCSGTYLQNMAEYHNLIYFQAAAALHVNLFVPSSVRWALPNATVRLTQATRYPDAETTLMTIDLFDRNGQPASMPAEFALRVRVPSWTKGMTAVVNGKPAAVDATPGSWATIRRAWQSGDKVEWTIPLTLRMEAVDRQHPDRVAVMRGPVVLVLEGAYHDPNFILPMKDDDLSSWLVAESADTLASGIWSVGLPPPEDPVTIFRVVPPDKRPVRLRFRPFSEVGENYPYFMYFDRKSLPWRLW